MADTKPLPRCPYCSEEAPLLTGRDVYPHRRDLWSKPVYACMPCGAWVGCHPGTTNRLGRLANAELRKLKMDAHAAFDPVWKSGRMSRKQAYAWLANVTGIEVGRCHIGMMSEDECRRVVEACEHPTP